MATSIVDHPNDRLQPGDIVQGYELMERTALLGVCPRENRAMISTKVECNGVQDRMDGGLVSIQVLGNEQSCQHREGEKAITTGEEGWSKVDDDKRELTSTTEIFDKELGPTLEYQCRMHESEMDHIYVNSNYRLRRKFAAGSHGEVWRATRRTLSENIKETSFILKRLFFEFHGESMVEMGLREAHFGKRLEGERHIARFVEFFFHDDRPFVESSADKIPPVPSTRQALWLVFLDEGISLRHYLYSTRASSTNSAVLFEPSLFWRQMRQDPHGEDVMKEILRQVLLGVAALHERGITHRDIKPSNILVHVNNSPTTAKKISVPVVKLADFGSAVDEYTLGHLYGTRGPSQAEETREYQPPEVLFNAYGDPYDAAYPHAYDMWSVGVVFLEMMLGSPQVFMISPRARAKLDAQLRGKDDETKRKSYLLHVFTHEFCLFQPSPHQLHLLWNNYALVSGQCHYGQFNTTILDRDPLHRGLTNEFGLDLMWKLLQWNPSQRISAQEALDHAFFKGPYVCPETKRRFATRHERSLHQAYLQAQRQRDEEMAMVVRPKYALPTTFTCPHCHRQYATITSCEQHMRARDHHIHAHTHFCQYAHEHTGLAQAIHHESLSVVDDLDTDIVTAGIGISVFQGKRKYMEDVVVIQRHEELAFTMYAIMDGHLGASAAEYVKEHLFSLLSDRLTAAMSDHNKKMYENPANETNERSFVEKVVLRQVFLELHDGFVGSQQQNTANKVTSDFSGCTLTVILHFQTQHRIVSANIGDSRAIKIMNPVNSSNSELMEIQPLTVDHWPHVENERLRIESSGGFVAFEGLWRVVGQLAVSRSIGDQHLRQYVTADPFVFHTSTDNSRMIVIASDGVWETMKNEDVAQFVIEYKGSASTGPQRMQLVTEALIQEAYVRGGLDNLAAIVIPLGNF